MGSRMKLLIILLFIGITGTLFLTKKFSQAKQEKINFLEIQEENSLKTGEAEADFSTVRKEEEPSQKVIFVHVCGAVKKEGVYELKEGDRVVDAIKMAGGLIETASEFSVNQAELLVDGSQVFIPFSDAKEESDADSKSNQGSKININTAQKEDLMTLPGVGETRALAILQYRKENGRFQKIEDIMKIHGIKESLFQKIKERIKV